MAEACRKIVQMALNDELNLDELSSESIRQCLSTANIPDPDLFIRTGGEKRMSNFMLWQLAYTELYFTDVHWPDFDENELMQALQSYASRVRRFGGIVTELG
jgi:undecaprenyl diphosphate synthase